MANTKHATNSVALKRSLSLPLITLYGLGTIIGAGIYVLIGEVAGQAGVYSPFAFLFAAVVAGFTAFAYAELSARFPLSAGEAVYVKQAFQRKFLTIATGWSVVLVGIVSAATLARGFVGYLELFLHLPNWLAISLLVVGLGLLAAWGINQSVWVATTITLAELAGLVIVLFVARDSLAALPQRWVELIPPLTADAWTGIALGGFLAFYAFIGFEDMVNVAEEVKNPQRNLPLAIIIALCVSTLLYMLVAFTAVLGLPIEALSHSSAPLATIIEHHDQTSPVSIGLISLLAVINGALIQIIMASRVIYGMARQAAAPRVFNNVNPLTRTPVRATIVTTITVLGLALWLPLVTLAQITSFITLTVFTLVNLSLWRLKILSPHPTGVVRYPLWVPVIGLMLCVSFMTIRLIGFV